MYQPSPELRALQLKCLEILDIVHKICIDNDIPYSLNGGTVVGAHLYGGFIPWDDDIDIMMTREHYNRFIKICPKCLPEGYRMVNYHTTSDYNTLFTKIEDINTTLVQTENSERIVSGIFIDIACYDKVPDHGIKKKILHYLYTLMQWVFCTKNNPYRTGVKRILTQLRILIFGKNPTRFYKFCEKCFVWLGHNENYHYSEIMFGHTIPFDAHIFENYSFISFEGKKYMIVRDYVEYLQRRYNRTDFREPEEKQVPPHHVYVNLNQPFSQYTIKQ